MTVVSHALAQQNSHDALGVDDALGEASVLANRVLKDKLHLYAKCSFIRKFERKLLELFSQGKLSGTTHTGIGQEANAVGMAMACRETDIFVSNHRCHAHVLAHTGLSGQLLQEVMGNASGFCGGLGGSQHICVKDRFFSNGIQGGILPLSIGLALAKKRQGKDEIVCAFMGDGTTGEGAVYESLNLAGILRLPLLVVVEDNGIAQTTPTSKTIAGTIRQRFEAFGFPVTEMDCPTADELMSHAAPIVERVRSGVPSAVIIKSARLGPHSKGDDTRSKEEIAHWNERDPMRRMAEELKQLGTLEAAEEIADELMASLTANMGGPQASPVLCVPNYVPLSFHAADMAELNGAMYIERLNNQLRHFLEEVPQSLLIGEDIGDPYGGAFKVSKGLQTQFPDQVIETPISELGFTGMAAGAALLGARPIVEFMFGDFVLLAFDQLINHAAKYPLMYNGQVKCPLIVRVPMGGGRGYGPTHSQNLEKHLCGVPNLQVIALSSYLPTQPIFKAIRQANGPIVLVEHKADYTRKIDVQKNIADAFDVKFSGSEVVFTPKGVAVADTVVFAYGGQIATALEAARQLNDDHKIAVQVIAVTQLYPFQIDEGMVAAARYVVTLEENSTGWGFGSEVAAMLMEQGHGGSQLLRIGSADTIVPSSRVLEKETLPDAAMVVRRILEKRANMSGSPAAVSRTVPEVRAVDMTDGAIEIKALQLNANDDELKIVEFTVADGAEVAVDQHVITVETSKAAEEIAAPAAGVVGFCRTIGDNVPVGQVMALIYSSREAWAAAKERRAALAKAEKVVVAAEALYQNHKPLTKVQKAMQKTLQISHAEIVPAYLLAECKLLPPKSKKEDPLDKIIYHTSRLLAKYPDCNAYFDGQGIAANPVVNFGFTADIDGDLYMGVVHDAQNKTQAEIASTRIGIILSLFRGEIDQAALAEPTVCITSLNGRWFRHQIPVVYPRTSVIIGFNQKPAESGAIEASFTFAYDHRVVSGYQISKFADELITNVVESV